MDREPEQDSADTSCPQSTAAALLREFEARLFTLLLEQSAEPADRPLSPLRLRPILLFQYLERLSDRQAALEVAENPAWQRALHLPGDQASIYPSAIALFRRRVETLAPDRKSFDAFLVFLRSKTSASLPDAATLAAELAEINRAHILWIHLLVATRALTRRPLASPVQSVLGAAARRQIEGRPTWGRTAVDTRQRIGTLRRDAEAVLSVVREHQPALLGFEEVVRLGQALAGAAGDMPGPAVSSSAIHRGLSAGELDCLFALGGRDGD